MKVGDKVKFFDTRVNHVNGHPAEIIADHKGLNCFSLSYNHNGVKGDIIQVSKCQVVKLKEKKD
jgi:hypothetical protein